MQSAKTDFVLKLICRTDTRPDCAEYLNGTSPCRSSQSFWRFSVQTKVWIWSILGTAALLTAVSLPAKAEEAPAKTSAPAVQTEAQQNAGDDNSADSVKQSGQTAEAAADGEKQDGQPDGTAAEGAKQDGQPDEAAANGEKTDAQEVKSLEQLNAELKKGGQKTIEINTDDGKPKFSLLRSANPEDYKRTEGIWISDSGNGRIVYMKNLEGQDFFPLGLSGSGFLRFLNPEQIWVDIEGRIYVADRGNNRIVRVDDIRGFGWTDMDNGFNAPTGVAFHGKRLFVSDTGNNRVMVYEKFGDEVPMAELKDDKIKDPGYLWLDMDGNLYVCCGENSFKGRIVRIPYDLTTPPSKWAVYKGTGLNGVTFSPTQFLQTDNGSYFVDHANERYIKADGFKGRNPKETGHYGHGRYQFLEPKGMSADQEGRIYIADTGNDRVVCIDQEGRWKAYDTLEPSFGLRAPKCVYVWSPRPAKEEEEDSDKDSKDKDSKKEADKNED